MTKNDIISDYTQKIRLLLYPSRIKFLIRKKRVNWEQLWGSLDIIEDTDLGILAYNKLSENMENGLKYLTVYGLFQLLYVQQYAVKHLCHSLKIDDVFFENEKLKEIRNIRNLCFGHPTETILGKKKTSYQSIIRCDLTKRRFTMNSYLRDGTSTDKEIEIPPIIIEQRKILSKNLNNIIKIIKKRDIEHKEKYKMNKLSSLFISTLNYHCNGICDAILNDTSLCAIKGQAGLSIIKKILKNFQKALEERGLSIATYDSVKYWYEILEEQIEDIEKYLKGLEEMNIHKSSVIGIVDAIEKGLNKLKEIAKEIDEDYSEEN